MTLKTIGIYAVAMVLSVTAAQAQKSVTGKHGGTASSSVTRSGSTLTATGAATGPKGYGAAGSANVTHTKTGTSDSGTLTGPKGGTTTVVGTTTNNGSSSTANGTVTGPRGNSKTGTVTVPK